MALLCLWGGDDKEDSGFEGTALYVSPEVLNSTAITGATDLWALGCVIYQMITGKTPFGADTEYLILKESQVLQMEMSRCTFRRASQRLVLETLFKDLISRLIRVKPAERLGAGSDSLNDNGFGHLKGHEFWGEYIDWSNVLTMAPPYTPDASKFPSSEELHDGADDEWMIEGEATLIESVPLGLGLSGKHDAGGDGVGVFQGGGHGGEIEPLQAR